MPRIVLLLLAVLGICLGAPSPAAAQSMLEKAQALAQQVDTLPLAGGEGPFRDIAPAPGAETQKAAATIRSRAASVDADYLRAVATAQGAQAFQLNLFDDLTVRFAVLDGQRDGGGRMVVRGVAAGGGMVMLVIDGARITGSVDLPGRSVVIMPQADGTHRITESGSPDAGSAARRAGTDAVRPRLPPPSLRRERPRSAEPPAEPPGEHRQATSTTLDLLVVYTPKALLAAPDMQSLVSLSVAYVNTTLSNSQVPVEVVLKGTDRVDYSEGTKGGGDILDDVADEVGDFARIAQLRAAVGADLVLVIADWNDSFCGYGYLNDDVDTTANLASHIKFGASVVKPSGATATCLPRTAAHELGHNLGAEHDRFQLTDDLPGPGHYHYGYVDLSARVMDVMAYHDECTANNLSCTGLPYFSNPDILYNGRPLGVPVAQPTAAHSARRVGEIAPFVARFSDHLTAPSQPFLSALVSGAGSVSSSTGGIACGAVCAARFASGTQVTLTPAANAGWIFKSWSGACTGSARTCTVAMTASRSVTATFAKATRIGTVFSSASQTGTQSFLRVINTGSAAGTVAVTLAHAQTGVTLASWTSPSVPANAALQFPISQIEEALPAGVAKPTYYTAAVEPALTGAVQHVLYRAADGTLTNASTCDAGVTADPTQVNNVHSSLFANGFPSSVAVINSVRPNYRSTALFYADDMVVTLGIFNAATGARLGTYVTDPVARDSQLILPISFIEAGAGIAAGTALHYVVRAERALVDDESVAFPGFLQHVVDNRQVGVLTDMTTVCTFETVEESFDTIAVAQPGPVFSGLASNTTGSFLRFFNTGSAAGTVNVTLSNGTSGTNRALATWTSPSIPAGAARQFAMSEIEAGISTKPQYYTALVQTQMDGVMQHVLYRAADGTLTNASTCDAGVSSRAASLSNVHSSLFDQNFPSTIAVNNTGLADASVVLGIYDAATGDRRGTYTTSVPGGGQALLPIATIEAGAGMTGTLLHYVIKIENSFNGYLQHFVNNVQRGVVTDMSTSCRLPPARSVRYAACASPTPCPLTANGAAVTGQIKRQASSDEFSAVLTGGRAYVIEVKGSGSSAGTLYRPYLQVYLPNGSHFAGVGGEGTDRSISYTFTPATSGTYFLDVAAAAALNSSGTVTRPATGTFTISIR